MSKLNPAMMELKCSCSGAAAESAAGAAAVATAVESAVDAPPAGTDGLLQPARSTSGTSRRYVCMRILRT